MITTGTEPQSQLLDEKAARRRPLRDVFHRPRIFRLLIGAVPLAAAVLGLVWYLLWSGSVTSAERFRLALAALDQGDLDQVASAATLLEGDPEYAAHVRLLDAAVLLRSGQPERSLGELTSLPLQEELRLPGLLLMGESLYRLGRLAEAEVVFRQLVREHPQHPDSHRWLGAIYFDLGANTAAIAELKRVAELDPGDYAPHRLIGLMHLDFEQNVEAIEHYRRALDLNPPVSVRQQILRELAKSLIAEREYSEALQTLEDAGGDSVVFALAAECYWSLGRQQEAREALRQAAALDPEERVAALLESRILMEGGQPSAAVHALERVLRRNPQDAECRYHLALAYRQLGDDERHAAEMARWQELADLHQKLTELNIKAIEQPRNAAIRDQIADLCLALGKVKLAEMWRAAARACRQAPDIPSSALNSSPRENSDHGGT